MKIPFLAIIDNKFLLLNYPPKKNFFFFYRWYDSLVILWKIWLARNKKVFDNVIVNANVIV